MARTAIPLCCAGPQGTKDDVSRKPPTRRAPSAPPGSASSARPHPDAEAGGGGRKRSRLRGDSLKAKRQREKAALQEVGAGREGQSIWGHTHPKSRLPRHPLAGPCSTPAGQRGPCGMGLPMLAGPPVHVSPDTGRGTLCTHRRSCLSAGLDAPGHRPPPRGLCQPQVRSLFGYWNAHSLPPRRDGVFRAAPAGAAQDADRVVAQYGAWSALVNLGGEPFQAFFDSREAAAAALQAALQSAGSAEPAASGPVGPRSSSGAQGAAAGQVAAEGGSPAAEGGAAAAARPALAAEVEGLSLGVPKAETSSPSETAAAAAGSAATGPARGGAAGLPAVAAPDIQQAQRLPAAVPKLEPAEQAYP